MKILDAQVDEDAKIVAEAFRTGGKSAAIAKINEFSKGQPAWAGSALLDKAMMILTPGSDREARLKRNEILRSGKVNDDIQPVGAEDPERALALKKHEDGLTKSQDGRKAKDGFRPRETPAPKKRYESFMDTVKRLKAEEAEKKQAKDVEPVGDSDELRGHIARLKKEPQSAMRDRLIKTAELAIEKGITRQEAARELARTKDTAPVAVKPVGLTPMPAEEDDKERYADVEPVGDAGEAWKLLTSAKKLEERGMIKTAKKAYEEAVSAATEAKDEEARREATAGIARLRHKETGMNDKGKRVRDRGRFKKVGDDRHEATMAAIRAEMWESAKNYGNAAEFYRKAAELSGQRSEKEEYEQKARKCTAMVNKRMNDRKGAAATEAKDEEARALAVSSLARLRHKETGMTDKGRRARDRGKFVKHTGKAADAIQEQRYGSEPADHMARAAQYEIAGDRARALDSYRAAATGYRRANDKANEAVAREGVAACQTAFEQQYDHPGLGRVRVCDSEESAIRTAVERTRAGERVRITDGRTVRPGRVRAADALTLEEEKELKTLKYYRGPEQRYSLTKEQRAREIELEKKSKAKNDDGRAKDGTAKEVCPKCGKQVKTYEDFGGIVRFEPHNASWSGGNSRPCQSGGQPVSKATDEHEGFKKLEGELAHEKGVTDPAALAASIGRKKYGAKGMAGKATDSRREIRHV